MSKYKIGDRVYFKGSEYQTPDYGTVIEKTKSYGDVWAVWDRDGDRCHFAEDDPDFQLVETIKMESCEIKELLDKQSERIQDLEWELESLRNYVNEFCLNK